MNLNGKRDFGIQGQFSHLAKFAAPELKPTTGRRTKTKVTPKAQNKTYEFFATSAKPWRPLRPDIRTRIKQSPCNNPAHDP